MTQEDSKGNESGRSAPTDPAVSAEGASTAETSGARRDFLRTAAAVVGGVGVGVGAQHSGDALALPPAGGPLPMPVPGGIPELLAQLPLGFVDAPTRARLQKLSQAMDQIFFLDATGELSADRGTLIRIVNDQDLTLPALRDIVLLETSKHLGRRLKARGNGLALTWQEAVVHGVQFSPVPISAWQSMGLNKVATDRDLQALIVRQYPGIPTGWIQPPAADFGAKLVSSFMHNRTVWDCVVAHIGFWGAIAVLWAVSAMMVIVLFVTVVSGGTLTLAALLLLIAALLAALGLAVTIAVLNCIENPEG